MDLSLLGWNNTFQNLFTPYAEDGHVPARVIARHRTVCRVVCADGDLEAVIAGKVRYRAANKSEYPVVGDWVTVSARVDEGTAVIHDILPRQTWFSRKAPGIETEEQVFAANIDTVFWVSSLNKVLNLRRIERFMVSVWDGGAAPAIILNKADLSDAADEQVAKVEEAAPGVPVLAMSAKEGTGIGQLSPYLKTGRTVIFIGQSGVGKSTLINRIVGEDVLKTGDIRESDDRGRHTTVSRQLVILPDGGMVIDTPGIRELQIWDADQTGLGAFGSIEELAAQCRFADCRHESEPGCAVKAAVEDGMIDRKQYENFMKLRREMDYLQTKVDFNARAEEKRRQKQFGRMRSSFKKKSPKR